VKLIKMMRVKGMKRRKKRKKRDIYTYMISDYISVFVFADIMDTFVKCHSHAWSTPQIFPITRFSLQSTMVGIRFKRGKKKIYLA
jgi:hypothetical protein